MLFSRPSVYGIRALSYLATLPQGRLAGANEIAAHEHIPAPFLSKVLLDLRRANLLRSRRGTRGGFGLLLPPSEISIKQILNSLGDSQVLTQCLIEDHACGCDKACALHSAWHGIREQLLHFLETTTLAEVVNLGNANGIAASGANGER